MRDWRAEVRTRVAALQLAPAAEADLVEELSQHVEQELAELSPRIGAAAAEQGILDRLADGSLLSIRGTRVPRQRSQIEPGAQGRGSWLADARDDLRFALRSFRRSPAFTAVAVLTLALGIGATTAMYSVVDAVLIRSLPFPDANRLVRVLPLRAGPRTNLSVADFNAVRERATGFASIAMYGTLEEGMTFVDGERPERLYGAAVTGDFFKTLGVVPLLGRGFTREDELPGAPEQIVVSYGFWQRRLGGARDVIGKTVRVQGSELPIIGVMPPGFWFPRSDVADYWLNFRPQRPTCECNFTKRVVARLAPGVTPAQLSAQLDAAASDVRTTFNAGRNKDWSFDTVKLQDIMVRGVRPVLLLLMAAVALVLLIACVNVASLLLTRAMARSGELTVRVALGASSGRLARQLLVETMMLMSIGGVAGVIASRWGLAWLLAMVPGASILKDAHATVSVRVLLVTIAATLVCTIGVGLAPAFIAAASDAGGVIREGGRSGVGLSRARRRLRDGLVIAEFAISVALVIGAGLLVRSLEKLRDVDTGIRSEGMLTASVSLSNLQYSEPRKIVAFTDRLRDLLVATPGIEKATLTVGLPPNGVGDQNNFQVEGAGLPPSGWEPVADHLFVGNDYFDTFGIPLLEGRRFELSDRDSTQPDPAIVSRTLAEKFFEGRPALGQRMVVGGSDTVTVIGVVGDVTYEGPAESTRLAIYRTFDRWPQWSFSVVLRTQGDPTALIPALQRTVASLDPTVALAQVKTMTDLMDESTAANRFRAILLTLLGGVALLLAAVGIYGLMSYAVSTRTRELGVRVALGARGGDVATLVLREGVQRAALGIAIGLGAALLLAPLLRNMLFGVAATDWVTFAAVPALLLFVALVACWLPALRAAGVDPIIALKSE